MSTLSDTPVRSPHALLLAFALVVAIASPTAAQPRQSFDAWLEDLRVEARARGYSDELLGQTLAGLTPLHRVIASDRKQPERTLTLEEYLRRRVSPWMGQRGLELAGEPSRGLAIWDIESGFGPYGGIITVFQALATLAWDPRRARLFRAQLYDALTMVDRDHIDAPSMTGSWAGAMGQPQFMPSSYLGYAVDLDGDGRRDIWTSPVDTLASIANNYDALLHYNCAHHYALAVGILADQCWRT